MKFIWLIINLLLVILILVRIPNNAGLTNFTTKSNFLGSANSAEKFLDNLTWILIICYFLFAITFNYSI